MWKLLKRKRMDKLYMVRKGDCYLKFTMIGGTGLDYRRLLEGNRHVRVSEDPKRWEDALSRDWEDTGHDCETLKEMYDLVHMVQLMED